MALSSPRDRRLLQQALLQLEEAEDMMKRSGVDYGPHADAASSRQIGKQASFPSKSVSFLFSLQCLRRARAAFRRYRILVFSESYSSSWASRRTCWTWIMPVIGCQIWITSFLLARYSAVPSSYVLDLFWTAAFSSITFMKRSNLLPDILAASVAGIWVIACLLRMPSDAYHDAACGITHIGMITLVIGMVGIHSSVAALWGVSMCTFVALSERTTSSEAASISFSTFIFVTMLIMVEYCITSLFHELQCELATTQVLLDHALDELCILDETQTVLCASSKLATKLGYSQKSIVGAKLNDILVAVDQTAISFRDFGGHGDLNSMGSKPILATSSASQGCPLNVQITFLASFAGRTYVVVRDLSDSKADELQSGSTRLASELSHFVEDSLQDDILARSQDVAAWPVRRSTSLRELGYRSTSVDYEQQAADASSSAVCRSQSTCSTQTLSYREMSQASPVRLKWRPPRDISRDSIPAFVKEPASSSTKTRIRRKCTYDGFLETPKKTIDHLIRELVYGINVRTHARCCSYHAHLRYLRQHFKVLLEDTRCRYRQQKKQLQCARCLCLQPYDCDEPDDYVCNFCGEESYRVEGERTHISGVSSGAQGEYEKGSTLSDSDDDVSPEVRHSALLEMCREVRGAQQPSAEACSATQTETEPDLCILARRESTPELVGGTASPRNVSRSLLSL